jgi:transposase
LFYCGIDIAKRNHEVSVIAADGNPLLDSITIANTQEGCEQLFSLFERLNVSKSDVIIGTEAAGHYWLARKMCDIIFTILKENRPYKTTPPKEGAEQ